MRKTLKIFLFLTLLILLILSTLFATFFIVTKSVSLDEKKLVNIENSIEYYTAEGKEITKESGNVFVTEFRDIPSHVKNAFIAIEDRRFYSHKGIDIKGLFRASFNNIKTFSFKEGASTISQQLIKNTHFSNEKTIKRKLCEIKLAKQLEKKYSKEEILEKYLNTIYFGDNCFGITSASWHYFSKSPKDLSIEEGALLAGIIKAPSNYSPFSNEEKCKTRRNVVLKIMLDEGYISESEYKNCVNKQIKLEKTDFSGDYSSYLSLAKDELNVAFEKIKYQSKKYKVYLNLNEKFQKNLISNAKLDLNNEFSAIVSDKNGKVLAYYSTIGNVNRQLGSVIKPILVYAPAIEENIVDSMSFILDEPIDFSGYSPSNYNDKYYGFVTVKESLSKSLNSCAVKLLNSVGVEKAKTYAEKSGIKFSETDNSLCLALGGMEKGAKLSEICSAYSVFLNEGVYCNSRCIDKITDENGKILYKPISINRKVFSTDTVEIVNDMLEFTVDNGTANKLKDSTVPLCAKTGTVGNDNGNTDAYCISFNSEYCLGVWMGNKEGELLANSITGGNYPTSVSAKIWQNVYLNNTPPVSYKKNNSAVTVELDKISFENQKLEIASLGTPKRYIIEGIFRKSRVPKVESLRFTYPKIENAKLIETNNGISISLCLTELLDFYIYREENGINRLIFDSKKNGRKLEVFDKEILVNHEYIYTIIPYFEIDGDKRIGEKFVFEKIKILPPDVYDDWWQQDDFNL